MNKDKHCYYLFSYVLRNQKEKREQKEVGKIYELNYKDF